VQVGDTFGPFVIGYMLIGLDAEGHKPDLNTDASAFYLKMHQMPDGKWIFPAADQRPPICHSYVSQTALAMRGLQLYAPATRKAEFAISVTQAARWLAKVEPLNNEDRSWRVIGLAWAANDKAATMSAMADLLAKQHSDGGWADLDTLDSAAYATGKALFAMQAAGMAVTEPAYKRGLDYLLKTQQQDGSWYVKTRALALQPFFDAGFPHAYDQYMSTAGSGWATIALALASGK
jgi:hypothetical protein